jgi:two-component system secretion response regulator SsrB
MKDRKLKNYAGVSAKLGFFSTRQHTDATPIHNLPRSMMDVAGAVSQVPALVSKHGPPVNFGVDHDQELLDRAASELAWAFVVHLAGSAEEAIQILAQFGSKIRLVLIDLDLPNNTGFVLIQKLRDSGQILIATSSMVTEPLLESATLFGARAALHKPLSRKWVQTVARLLRPESTTDRKSNRLTPREEELLRLIAKGCRLKEIADHLDITLKTAFAYRGQIQNKLNAFSAADLTSAAIRLGLVEL